MRIPLKAISHSGEADHNSGKKPIRRRSDARSSMLRRLIGVVKENLSRAKRRRDGFSDRTRENRSTRENLETSLYYCVINTHFDVDPRNDKYYLIKDIPNIDRKSVV